MATVKKLTHQTIKGLTTDKEYEKFFEEEWQKGSFGVRVSGKTGRKSFVLRYRNESGKQRKITLGKFDETGSSGLSLSQAREKAYEIIGKVAAGKDPAESNEDNSPETIKGLVDRFIKVHGKNISETTKDDYKSRLERDLIPEYGNLSPDELTRGKIAKIMDHIAVDRDSNVSANRFRSVTHKLYNFAVGRGIVDSNPVSDVPTKKEDSSRDRHLSDEEIKILWGVLEDKDPVIESFYKILLLCGQRSGETKESKWEHIEGGIWTVPSENAKNGRENQVFLPSLAKSIIDELRPITGHSDFVFNSPSPQVENQPVRWFSNTLKGLKEECGFEFTAHDLRRTCASGMARIGVDRMTIAKILNHKSMDNEITAIYDRYQREEEKKDALMQWNKHVKDLVS